MERVALSIHDLNNKKLCDLYDSSVKVPGQAHTICLTTELNGWKEISFVLPYMVDKKKNFRWKYIQNEYKLRLIRGDYEDWYTITRPKKSHSSGAITNTVTCYHISSLLKTKNLYLVFDDTNGIDTCPALIEKALAGTGWKLGACDTFYERDGKTEKIRSLSSDGKVGAHQLVATICNLFCAYPVYHGATKTVDIHALVNKKPLKEMIVGQNLTALTTDYDSDNLVTRLYVEGEYGEDGYVGIDDVNPTGLPYLLNFDYYKKIGLFTEEHQEALDSYLQVHKNLVAGSSTSMETILAYENELNEIWGQPKFVYYLDGAFYYASDDLPEDDKQIAPGDTVYTLLSDGTYEVEQVPSDGSHG